MIPKYITKQIKPNTILVAKEKHGNRYFLANTEEALVKACLKLLQERLGEYQYCIDGSYPKPDFDDVNALPESLRESAKVVLDRYNNNQKQNNDLIAYCNSVEKAIKEKDDSAVILLFQRRDHEYENVFFEFLEEV